MLAHKCLITRAITCVNQVHLLPGEKVRSACPKDAKGARENIPRGLSILCPGLATGTAARYSAAMARGALL